MALIFLVLLGVSIIEIAWLVRIAQSQPLDMIGQAMHPFNVIGFLFLVTNVDFLSLFQIVGSGGGAIFAGSTISFVSDVVKGYLFFVLCQTSIVIACWFAVAQIDGSTRLRMRARRGQTAISAPAEVGAARMCIAVCITGAIFAAQSIVLISLQHGSLSYVAGIRTRFFADNPILLVIVTTMAPAFILFGSRDKMRAILLALPVIMLFLSLVGGRSKLLYPAVAVMYWFCRRHKLSVIWVYLATPVLIFVLVFYTYISRMTATFGSFQQYLDASGGMFGALFDEPSISMAEAITINVNYPILDRTPWESLLGAFMLPIPRAWVPWKPLGVSTEFSMVTDYTRWNLVKSEWTVTGFVNLFYDVGYIGAIIGCGMIAFLWTRILVRSAGGRRGTAFVGPIAIICAYQFVRGDLYIVSQFLWPTAIVSLIYATMNWIIRALPGFKPAAKVNMRRPVRQPSPSTAIGDR